MSNSGCSVNRLALLVALIALIPAFGQWLFPIHREDITIDTSEINSTPGTFSVLDLYFSRHSSSEGLEGSVLWLNGKKIPLVGSRGIVVKLDPGLVQMFLETSAAKSNVLEAEAVVGETIRVVCSVAIGVPEEVSCDRESEPTLATVRIRRRPTRAAHSLPFLFFVNGEKMASLANGEEGEFKIKPGSYELSVAAFHGGLLGPGRTVPIALELGPGDSTTVECRGVLGFPDSLECKVVRPISRARRTLGLKRTADAARLGP